MDVEGIDGDISRWEKEMDSGAPNPEENRSFQQWFLLSIWIMYIASGLLLTTFRLMGIIEVRRIEPTEEVRREEEILHVLQRFKTGLPRAEEKKLAWLIQRESGR